MSLFLPQSTSFTAAAASLPDFMTSRSAIIVYVILLLAAITVVMVSII